MARYYSERDMRSFIIILLMNIPFIVFDARHYITAACCFMRSVTIIMYLSLFPPLRSRASHNTLFYCIHCYCRRDTIIVIMPCRLRHAATNTPYTSCYTALLLPLFRCCCHYYRLRL